MAPRVIRALKFYPNPRMQDGSDCRKYVAFLLTLVLNKLRTLRIGGVSKVVQLLGGRERREHSPPHVQEPLGRAWLCPCPSAGPSQQEWKTERPCLLHGGLEETIKDND